MKPQILRDLRFLFSLVVACGPMGVPGAAWPVSWAGLRRGRWPASLMVLLVAPRVFRAPEVPAAVCAGGRRPAREIATRELRSEWSISRPALALPPPTGTAARPCASKPGQAPPPPINFARNSPAACSNIECASLELQRFWGVSKNDRDKLRAKYGWR